jgi:pimeloyl-ACP methyl ester carboxylesterase
MTKPSLVALFSTTGRATGLLALALGLLAASAAAAQEVALPHRAITLNATLTIAEGKSLADGVVLMVHGTMAHKDMEIMRQFRSLFAQKGYSTLAINLGLDVNDRRDNYDCARPSTHKYGDALDEIGAWLDWLKKQGAKSVVLLGHSRGGHQVVWFAAQRGHALARSLVLLAPLNPGAAADPARYQARFGKPLKPNLERAQALLKAGKGKTRLEKVGFLSCDETSVTAESFVSYYEPDPGRDLVPLLKRVGKPTLAVVAGDDRIVHGLDKLLAPLADGRRLRVAVIAGADHFFRDLYGEDAIDEMVKFLRP